MSCDIPYKEIGTASKDNNRIFWIIPDFYELEKNMRFKSPPFTLKGSTWQLRYSCFKSTLRSREWLDIGVKLLSNTLTLMSQPVRFGVAGNNLEISKTFETNQFAKYHSLTVPYEDSMSEWVLDGNLRLFLMIENSSEEEAKNEDWEDVEAVEVSTQTEDEIKEESTKDIDQIIHVEAATQTDEVGGWKLPKDFLEFLLDGNFYDVILKVGEKEIKAHRSLLAVRSQIFLDKITQQAKENTTCVVELQGVDPESFLVFLRFLYSGKAENINPENAHKLYRMAKEYKVYELERICLDHIMENITVEYFCDILTVSLQYEVNDLIDACSQFFMENSLNIIETSKWETYLSKNPVVGNGLYVRLLKSKK